jgi:hypothetical protein
MGLLRPFTLPIRTCRFASSIVIVRAYKAGGHPCEHLRALAQTPIASIRALEKRERERKIEKERSRNRGKFSGLRERWFSFPLKP